MSTKRAHILIDSVFEETIGSDQFGGVFSSLLPALKKSAKSVGTFVKANPDMMTEAISAAVTVAATSKANGQMEQDASQSLGRSLTGQGLTTAEAMGYIGEYRQMVGAMQTQLTAKGVVTNESQAEMIRNALADELYSKPFTSNLKKATLIYIINKIDQKLYAAAQ